MLLDEYIQVSFAVKKISARVKTRYESLRECANKIRGRITYHLKNGHIRKNNDGLINANDLRKFVCDEFPGLFDDWLISHDTMSIGVQRPETEIYTFYCSFPSSLEHCHELIEQQAKTILTLQAEIARLRPDAERYKKICDKNRKNGCIKKNP